AFARARIPFHVVSGMLFDDERAWAEIREWIQAARVRDALRDTRIGFLGHTYPGMLDLYSDFTRIHAQLGIHIEILEMEDLQARIDIVTEHDVERKIEEIKSTFEIAEPGRDRISQPVS
ncbi:MAG: arabinose isomerase, partial [Chloroflexota bacterium]